MTRARDVPARTVHSGVPPGTGGRERRAVPIATILEMISRANPPAWPEGKWNFHRHHDECRERLRRYRDSHRGQVREYNRQYTRKRRARERGHRAHMNAEVQCSPVSDMSGTA